MTQEEQKREDRRKIYIPCDICLTEGASEIKGGYYNMEHNIWFVCKDCLCKIEDKRKKE